MKDAPTKMMVPIPPLLLNTWGNVPQSSNGFPSLKWEYHRQARNSVESVRAASGHLWSYRVAQGGSGLNPDNKNESICLFLSLNSLGALSNWAEAISTSALLRVLKQTYHPQWFIICQSHHVHCVALNTSCATSLISLMAWGNNILMIRILTSIKIKQLAKNHKI